MLGVGGGAQLGSPFLTTLPPTGPRMENWCHLVQLPMPTPRLPCRALCTEVLMAMAQWAGLWSSLSRRCAHGHQGLSALHSQVAWGPLAAAVPHSLPVWLHPTELRAVACSFMEPHTHFPLKGELPDIPVTWDLWPRNLDLGLAGTTQA